MELSGNSSKPSLPSGLSLIERAQELRWTMQLATAVLFTDLVLAWHTGKGIAHWSLQTDLLLANSGFVIVSVLAFGVLMSVVMPLAAEVFRQLGWQLLINIPWPSWMRTEHDYRRPAGCVLPNELRAYAYRRDDRALLDIVDAHNEKKKKVIAENLSTGQMVFAVLSLGFVDYFPGLLGINAATLLREIPATFSGAGELAIAVALLMALVAMKVTWFSMTAPDWIDYPPLYEEIERSRRAQRGIP